MEVFEKIKVQCTHGLRGFDRYPAIRNNTILNDTPPPHTSRSLYRMRHIILRECGAHVQCLGELSIQLDF